MNYRHSFHAGNAGDVLKHLALAFIIDRLKAKPAPITVIDSHAGAGLYALDTGGGEWQDGIGRLLGQEVSTWPAAARPYAEALGGDPMLYPGSPLIALRLLRDQDRLIACETGEEVAEDLRFALAHDPRAAVHRRDGWSALRAFLPIKTGRSLVLIDPPFEAANDFALLAEHMIQAARRASTAIIVGWYPVKGRQAADRLHEVLRSSGIAKILAVELLTQPDHDPLRFAGSGLVVIRPPWHFDTAMAEDLPRLLTLMGQAHTGSVRVDWLSGETVEAE
ncbi:23S rRNA (adenine(2030)-N(6))-methyltransferase RlmJ [Zavarzinia aquatilis]|uniref:Ribosomal RNA large subunit methyltransferase J n=1 Tax=Zavarzinia aquatilis TaxID=2211142 RepID=A0A317EIM5_9PROT|nr:23S rRNA (adenine(2030)-N(6))-methyltransferase RlmJ [Zavarzinia aquatilis]PWR25095.1 23S rRNA (adenine(2030)-N(6))-methyltransferase RlmJ [Zavarzinia aquatilis]